MDAHGRLAKLAGCHLVGKVGAHEAAHGDVEHLVDDLADQLQSAVLPQVKALDERDSYRARFEYSDQRTASAGEELVGHDEDEVIGVFDRLDDVRLRNLGTDSEITTDTIKQPTAS